MGCNLIGSLCLLFAIAVGLKYWRCPEWFELLEES